MLKDIPAQRYTAYHSGSALHCSTLRLSVTLINIPAVTPLNTPAQRLLIDIPAQSYTARSPSSVLHCSTSKLSVTLFNISVQRYADRNPSSALHCSISQLSVTLIGSALECFPKANQVNNTLCMGQQQQQQQQQKHVPSMEGHFRYQTAAYPF